MEMIGRVIWIGGLTGKSYESVRRACWRQGRPVKICWQKRIDRSTERSDRTNKGSGLARQHLCAVKGERLRTKITRACRVEDVHAHVISIGPNAQVRVIKEIRPKVKSVTVITARGI